MRVCRICGKTDNRFYDSTTTTGRAAGNCCQPCWVAKSVAWRHANKKRWNAKRHRTQAMRKYALTDTQYDALYLGASCAGCGEADELAIDHDHVSGAVRGVLCRACNLTVGTAKDDPAVLRALASYLESF